jgi:hypothetical protein
MCNCNEQFRMITPTEALSLKREAFIDTVLKQADQEIRTAALNGRTDITLNVYKGGRDDDEFGRFIQSAVSRLIDLGFNAVQVYKGFLQYRAEVLITWKPSVAA